MHSIASNKRKSNEAGPIDENVVVDALESYEDDKTPVAYGKTTITPEDELSGKQQMRVLYATVEGKEELELLVMTWADGLRGTDARDALGWGEKKYDAARKRLQRRLSVLDPERRST